MDKSEIRDISEREALIIELVYELARGSETHMGLELETIIKLLLTPIKKKDGKTVLECLNEEGHSFIKELLENLN